MKKKICVATGTRAEFGLLSPVIARILADDELELLLAVTGSHLDSAYGATSSEIERSGFPIDVKIDILQDGDSPTDICHSLGLAISRFADYFSAARPDLLIVLGDRYEILGVALAAAFCNIPIAHIHGGEATEGANDEFTRHSITKMSCLHFASCERYRRRIIQLGEQPGTVFNVGALGVENIRLLALMSSDELAESLAFPLKSPYAVVTFHPVTLEAVAPEAQMQQLLSAIERFPDMQFIFTKANADSGGRAINRMIDDFAATHKNAAAFFSLGLTRYLSAISRACLVLGNSSSGIYEAPSFGIPTVNIGDRQRGRVQAASVINCAPLSADIAAAVTHALTPEFSAQACAAVSPYGDGHTSGKIVSTVKEFFFSGKIDLKKRFYDLPPGDGSDS